MEMTRDTQTGAPPWSTADHTAEDSPPDETATRTRELYAQYAENVRETPEAAPIPARRARRNRASRAHATDRALTHEAIAVRAFELYAASGFPDGRDVEFWLEAERQLRSEVGV